MACRLALVQSKNPETETFTPPGDSKPLGKMGQMSMPGNDPYRMIVEGTRHLAMYMVSAEGDIVSWNAGAEKLHGFSAAEMIGKSHALLFPESDRNAHSPETQLRDAEQSGTVSESRWMLRKDGSQFWSEGWCSVIRDPAGMITGFAKVTRDASETRQLADVLERTNEELNRFAFVVSHDLQEPVRTIQSYGELLSRRYKGRLDSDADDFIQFMTAAANQMTQLLKDLLSYSQAGRSDRTRMESIQASTVVQWAIMNVAPLIKDTGANVTFDPLPAIDADQTQIANLFQQLLTNAMTFRGTDAPRIHISAVKEQDDLYRFSVRDNGVGVAREFHERIFGVFKRLHGKDVPGTGIGLAICRKIVEAHRGRIWIDSEAGRGATFYFTLPAAS